MLPHGLHQPSPDTGALEAALAGVEHQLDALRQALTAQDADAVERTAADLRAALRGG